MRMQDSSHNVCWPWRCSFCAAPRPLPGRRSPRPCPSTASPRPPNWSRPTPRGNSPSPAAANSEPCRPPTWPGGAPAPSPPAAPLLVLADGGLLPADVPGIDKDTPHRPNPTAGHAEDPAGIARRRALPPAGRPAAARPPAGPRRPRQRRRGSPPPGQRRRSDRPGRRPGRRHAADHAPTPGRRDVATRRIVAVVFTPALRRSRRRGRAFAPGSD